MGTIGRRGRVPVCGYDVNGDKLNDVDGLNAHGSARVRARSDTIADSSSAT
jgi:hypothetical protein